MNREIDFHQHQHPVCKWTHEVFPSFRGEDVRRNFLSHILKEFLRKGIIPFIDNDIKRGESIGPELVHAIKRSKVAVVLLSKNYASSKWCLDELVEIMKCKEESGQMVFVIFYEVDPSEVKKLTGDFGAVFEKTCAGQTEEDIGRWRQALTKVATIAGYHSRNWDNEAIMIEDIVTEISKRLISFPQSRYIEGLIGMGTHMGKMERLLCLGSEEVRMVGIWGPSGIGKTTIARVLHSQISDVFELSVFMAFKPSYARPTCSDDYDERLQLEQRFLSELLNRKDLVIPDLGAARNFLMGKKVLVIFDGVEQLVQLDVMREAQCLGLGSRIIITTQNLRMLNAFEIKHIYQVGLPPDDEALQIFCMSAFGQSSPKDGFEKLAWEVTSLVGRLPLGLKVMGSHFRGILSKQEWKAELPRLRVRLDGDIGSILKFSYDALQEEDKDLFLYIACFFFKLEDLNDGTFEDVVKHRFSNVRQGLEVLVQRSLLSMHSQKYYRMHDLLVQLGREIVRNQSICDPGRRRFLVDAKEICEVLSANTGSKNFISISIDSSRIGGYLYTRTEGYLYISERAFEDVSNLQLLRFQTYGGLQLPRGLKYLPSQLRILEWDYYPMKSLPSNFNPKFLVKIKLQDSKLKKLWKGIQPLGNLKFMDLSDSRNLKKLPDLSAAINLFHLDLRNCSSVAKLPSSIGNLTNLIYFDLSGCSNMKEFPSIGNLTNLICFNLSGCSNMKLRKCSSVLKLPSSIGNLTNLQYLVLRKCSNLVELPSSIGNLSNLQDLDLSECSSLVELPSSIGNLINLSKLNLSGCSKLEVLPDNINLASLETLDLNGCSQLRSFPEISTNIEVLYLCGTLIEEVPLSVKSWSRLKELRISYCKNLGEFPNLVNVITKLELNDTDIEEFPLWFSGVSRLRHLALYNCRKLVSLPQLPDSLWNLEAENCDSLERFAGSFPNSYLRSFIFINCWKLNEEARDIIMIQAPLSTTILPGREVPELFTHRCTSGGSVKANLIGGGNFKRFQACISLVCKGDKGAHDDEYADVYYNILDKQSVYCSIVDKQSGLEILQKSPIYQSPLLSEHLYTFPVQAFKQEPGEHLFEFELKVNNLEIAQCGIRPI